VSAQKEQKLLLPDTFLCLKIYFKSFCGRSSAPNPTGGAYSVLPDPLARFGAASRQEWGRKKAEEKRRKMGRERRRERRGRGKDCHQNGWPGSVYARDTN